MRIEMGKVKNNFSANQDAQPIDSLPSSLSQSGSEKDPWIGSCGNDFMQDTVPFEEDAWIDDEYTETQVMENECVLLCSETQDVGLGFQTQEDSLVEEKQSLQGSDCLDTQVLDCFDEEVVVADSDDDDVTVFMEDNSEREISYCGDSRIRGGKLLLSEDKNSEHANDNIKSTAAAVDARSNEHGISRKVARFASVRSAAFRASAARLASKKLLNSDCSTSTDCPSAGHGATHNSRLEQNVGNQECPPSMSVEKKNEGNRTARKLFLEDDSPEESCPPGLSYIDSQEPGEASEANALGFVDKLISESGLKFDVEADCGRRTEEKSESIPSVKGPQELAKKVSYKVRAAGKGIFDWDDNREDEGGGDICRRRKEDFFGVGSKAKRSSTLPREHIKEIHENDRVLGVAVDKRTAYSDSRLLHRSVTRGQKIIKATTKNLDKEFDAALDEHNKKISDMRELVALGYDKQVAAEAVDAVCSGDCRKVDARLKGKKLSPEEEREFSTDGVITRPSKGTKRIHAMGRDELLKRRMKKASPSPAKACGKSIERSSKGDQLDKEGPCCVKRRKVHTASRETKNNLIGELDKSSMESNTRMFDRREEEGAGPDTQMAAEAINDLHSGDAREIDHEANCIIGKKYSRGGVISSRGVVTRKSKRLNGIQAVDNDVESLKPKTKKAKSIHAKACEKNVDSYSKNEKLDMPEKVAVSSTEKGGGELSNKHCTSKLLKQSSGGEAKVLNYPKQRRSARIPQDQDNEARRSSDAAFDTPVKSKVPSKNVSPICMGDEYHRLTCNDSRTSNTIKEFRSLTLPLVEPIPETKSTRKRRDLGSIRVLFSQHLDEDLTKHQKKILAKFDISEASSMMEATHFIANNFMRTRNMLEAIASGKPVVTTQWLESIDQVNIYVDEDQYILRDSKKEKEFCFNMGVSLTRARQNPLLKGRRVFITPNTKPGDFG